MTRSMVRVGAGSCRRPRPRRDGRGPGPGLRGAHRSQRRRQPAPHDHVRGLSRRRGALRHGVPVRRWRRGVREPDAAARASPRRSRRAATGRSSASSARRSRSSASPPRPPAAPRAIRPRSSWRSRSTRSTSPSCGAAPTRSARWATEHGFRLPPDAPEVLDFYAARSPIFLAAVFDADAAAERGQAVGDGTPVHITIPTDNPWVPLRILGPRQDRRRAGRGRRLHADRPSAGPPAGPDRRQRPLARPQRPGDGVAARRPALGPWHGVGARERLAHQGPHRRGRTASSRSTSRSTPAGRASRRAVMAGLDLPARLRDAFADARPRRGCCSGLAFTIGGIGGILLLIRRRPPVQLA